MNDTALPKISEHVEQLFAAIDKAKTGYDLAYEQYQAADAIYHPQIVKWFDDDMAGEKPIFPETLIVKLVPEEILEHLGDQFLNWYNICLDKEPAYTNAVKASDFDEVNKLLETFVRVNLPDFGRLKGSKVAIEEAITAIEEKMDSLAPPEAEEASAIVKGFQQALTSLDEVNQAARVLGDEVAKKGRLGSRRIEP